MYFFKFVSATACFICKNGNLNVSIRIFTRNRRDIFFFFFCADGIMITNNNNNYVFLNIFMFRIMNMTLININPEKEIFHHYDFPVYTASKYRDPKLDTYRQITQECYRNAPFDFKEEIASFEEKKNTSATE